MSGTYAVLSMPIPESKGLDRPEEVYLNGVPGHIVPSTNDRSRDMDIIVFGAAVSNTIQGPAGAIFFVRPSDEKRSRSR